MENETKSYDVIQAHMTVCIKYIVFLNFLKVATAVLQWIL